MFDFQEYIRSVFLPDALTLAIIAWVVVSYWLLGFLSRGVAITFGWLLGSQHPQNMLGQIARLVAFVILARFIVFLAGIQVDSWLTLLITATVVSVTMASEFFTKNLMAMFALRSLLKEGDYVLINGTHGKVIEIGHRVKLETDDLNVVSFPPSEILAASIVNQSAIPFAYLWANIYIIGGRADGEYNGYVVQANIQACLEEFQSGLIDSWADDLSDQYGELSSVFPYDYIPRVHFRGRVGHDGREFSLMVVAPEYDKRRQQEIKSSMLLHVESCLHQAGYTLGAGREMA